ncbi:hypothetical protein ACFSKN_14835 [Mariniflexile gromovii]|uniref:Uncharacterized protein n=1 Tax=Mariniflexile gromovii TaxID=362523 RepID=A0ABS4BRN9_9FLAO|nr:hypothetical protein [Mariniflexile gromovii]MBP0903243.1 hypothetical protein [Mariniflexile gromovii]
MTPKKKIRFDSLTKSELSKFNDAEIQGWVIDQFCQMEWRIDNIIMDYFKPENKRVFETVVLNSSVMSIGGKLKILSNIGINKTTIGKLRELSSIRNGFAHCSIGESVTVFVSLNDEIYFESESTINVMNSSGVIIPKSAYEYVSKFLILRNELSNELP